MVNYLAICRCHHALCHLPLHGDSGAIDGPVVTRIGQGKQDLAGDVVRQVADHHERVPLAVGQFGVVDLQDVCVVDEKCGVPFPQNLHGTGIDLNALKDVRPVVIHQPVRQGTRSRSQLDDRSQGFAYPVASGGGILVEGADNLADRVGVFQEVLAQRLFGSQFPGGKLRSGCSRCVNRHSLLLCRRR